MKLYTEDQVHQEFRKWVGSKKQSQVAKELGVSDTFVSLVLRGKIPPTGKVLKALGFSKYPMPMFIKE